MYNFILFQCELQPLNTIASLQDRVGVFTERPPGGTTDQLRRFEDEFDDILETKEGIEKYWIENEDKVVGNEEFKEEFEDFEESVNIIRESYKKFIKTTVDR